MRLNATEADLVTVRQMVSNSGSSSWNVKVKPPESYRGTREYKVIADFIYDCENYFKASHGTSEDEKLFVVATLLSDDSNLRWCGVPYMMKTKMRGAL